MRRLIRHLLFTRRRLRRVFTPAALDAIEAAVRTAERGHRGEIRFAVEGALDLAPLLRGQAARDRAVEVFSHLHVWDTEHNNGVLIYVLLADRGVEILADRGIHRHVAPPEWQSICRAMETAFRAGDFQGGAVTGIRMVSALLARHFPPAGEQPNELPDRPFVG